MRLADPASRQPDRYRPWTRSQVWVADAWPTRRDQPVSVALSPAGNRLALSVGQRLSVSDITDGSRLQPRLQMACALAPGLTWSPGGDKLAFRDVMLLEPAAAYYRIMHHCQLAPFRAVCLAAQAGGTARGARSARP